VIAELVLAGGACGCGLVLRAHVAGVNEGGAEPRQEMQVTDPDGYVLMVAQIV
jgi:hypothetical protein